MPNIVLKLQKNLKQVASQSKISSDSKLREIEKQLETKFIESIIVNGIIINKTIINQLLLITELLIKRTVTLQQQQLPIITNNGNDLAIFLEQIISIKKDIVDDKIIRNINNFDKIYRDIKSFNLKINDLEMAALIAIIFSILENTKNSQIINIKQPSHNKKQNDLVQNFKTKIANRLQEFLIDFIEKNKHFLAPQQSQLFKKAINDYLNITKNLTNPIIDETNEQSDLNWWKHFLVFSKNEIATTQPLDSTIEDEKLKAIKADLLQLILTKNYFYLDIRPYLTNDKTQIPTNANYYQLNALIKKLKVDFTIKINDWITNSHKNKAHLLITSKNIKQQYQHHLQEVEKLLVIIETENNLWKHLLKINKNNANFAKIASNYDIHLELFSKNKRCELTKLKINAHKVQKELLTIIKKLQSYDDKIIFWKKLSNNKIINFLLTAINLSPKKQILKITAQSSDCIKKQKVTFADQVITTINQQKTTFIDNLYYYYGLIINRTNTNEFNKKVIISNNQNFYEHVNNFTNKSSLSI